MVLNKLATYTSFFHMWAEPIPAHSEQLLVSIHYAVLIK